MNEGNFDYEIIFLWEYNIFNLDRGEFSGAFLMRAWIFFLTNPGVPNSIGKLVITNDKFSQFLFPGHYTLKYNNLI